MVARRRPRRGGRRHARRGRKARHHKFTPYKMRQHKGVINRALNYPTIKWFETTLETGFSATMPTGSLTAAQTTTTAGYGICAIPVWPVNPFGTAYRGLPLITAAGLFSTTSTIFNAAAIKNYLYNSTTNTGLYEVFRVFGAELIMDIIPSNVTDSLMVSLAPLTTDDAVPATTGAGVSQLQQVPGAKCIFAKLNQSNIIRSRINVMQMYGQSKAAVIASGSYASTYSSGVPSNAIGWAIGFNTAQNAMTGAAICMRARLRVWGRFEAPLGVGVLDT